MTTTRPLRPLTYYAPTASLRVRIAPERLRDAIRDAVRNGTADEHDPFLVAATPGAAEALAALDAALAAAEAPRAAQAALLRDRGLVTELQNPHTPAGRLDEIRAQRAAAEAAVAAAGREVSRAREAVWRLLYVVDDATDAARRDAAAERADAEHARVVEAFATLRDALDAREAAYATAGAPDSRRHWTHVRRTTGINAPDAAMRDALRVLSGVVEDFPEDVVGARAAALEAAEAAATPTR